MPPESIKCLGSSPAVSFSLYRSLVQVMSSNSDNFEYLAITSYCDCLNSACIGLLYRVRIFLLECRCGPPRCGPLPLWATAKLTPARSSTGWTPAARSSTGWTPAARSSTGRTPAARSSTGWTPAARSSTGRTPAARSSAGELPLLGYLLLLLRPGQLDQVFY